jgi:membrane-associated phospholipid phosphatase
MMAQGDLRGRLSADSMRTVPQRPIDLLNLSVTVFLLLLTLLLAVMGRVADWLPLAGLYAGMAALTLAATFVDRRRWGGWIGAVFADFYSLLVVPNIFNSLQPLITGVGLPNQDATLIAIDRALLGVDATLFTQRFVTPWLNDLMHLSYCTYYVFPLVVGVAMYRRSKPLARRFIFTVALAFYVSYVGYFLVPARGPRTAQADQYTVSTRTTPISTAIYDFLDNAEKTKDDVFPSGHNMITAVCLICAWRFDRRVFWPLVPIAVALAISTVYCRFHYVIDVIAGIALAFATVPIGYALCTVGFTPPRPAEQSVV